MAQWLLHTDKGKSFCDDIVGMKEFIIKVPNCAVCGEIKGADTIVTIDAVCRGKSGQSLKSLSSRWTPSTTKQRYVRYVHDTCLAAYLLSGDAK